MSNSEIPVVQLSKQGEEAFGDFLRAIFQKNSFVPAAILQFFAGDELAEEVRLDYQDAWTNPDGKETVIITGNNEKVLNDFVKRWISVFNGYGVENIQIERTQ